MEALLVLLMVAALALAILTLLDRRLDPLTYRRKPLMHDGERRLFERLTEAFPEHLVLAQVSMAAFIAPIGRGRVWQRARNRISQKFVDYVICDLAANPIVVIELDGKSHERATRRRADRVKDDVLAAAGVRLIRWNPKSVPTGSFIRDVVFQPPAPTFSTVSSIHHGTSS